MKLLAIILLISFTACTAPRFVKAYQEKAILTCFIPEEGNRTILKLQTVTGRTVTWRHAGRGIGKTKRDFTVGTKYIVHFNRMDRVIKIIKATSNE